MIVCMMTTATCRTIEILREVTQEIEAARSDAGHWFGRFSMYPLSVDDREIEALARQGLIEVIDWVEGHDRYVPDDRTEDGYSVAYTPDRPLYVRASTDGWVTLTR